MSKKELQDRIANFLEKIISGFSITLASIVTYLFLNIEKLSSLKVIFLSFGALANIVILGLFLYFYLKNLKKIGDR